jgi:hypothetical protein
MATALEGASERLTLTFRLCLFLREPSPSARLFYTEHTFNSNIHLQTYVRRYGVAKTTQAKKVYGYVHQECVLF